MTTEPILISAIAGLTSAVVFLFFWFKANYERVNKRLEVCEKDRIDLWRKIAELQGQPCDAPHCPFRGVDGED